MPPSPLLSVTAALTLRLDYALLDHFIPAPSSKAFVRSGFAHSLLTPLHEGPVYPDESPLQSQARAKASSALGLDGPNGLGSYLAHLSKDVIGGNNSPSAELESTRLVLSVELENPMESESSFVVNDIHIKIEKGGADQQDSHQILAKPLQPMAMVLPIQLTRGSQHNMLFYVSAEADHAQHNGRAGALDNRAAGARNVTITVSGRPQGEQEQLADFDSQWNCALDLAPVLSDAAKRDYIAKGPSMGSLDQSAAGPVAGNAQYSASSLRAAALGANRSTYTQADITRTPKSGQLGLGFPTPLRESSARHVSTATIAAPSSELVHPQTSTSFLDKAKARATRTRTASHSATKSIRPWMSTSTGIREAAGGGLVVLSTVSRAGTNTRDVAAEGEVKFESSLGEDGVARPSVSTGAKTLHPTSILVSTADERAVRFQTGDTVMVDLAILYKSGASIVDDEADAIAGVTLSWAQPSPCLTSHDLAKAGNRDSMDTTAGLVKGRLMDADSARLKSSLLTSQAETLNGLIPVQDHLSLQASILPSQSRTIAMGLRCLSPGYHAIPSLQMQYQSMSGGRETVSLDGLGHVYVTPAAVL
uniref:Uncharacterized protein n=1 Tax=Kalmanozyma brasiliensis (strain GHG001) TaxID=1365824 RepID=V5ETN9_KALBG